jgi:hypothetical protein
MTYDDLPIENGVFVTITQDANPRGSMFRVPS